ncbi:MAG: transposon-encoded TnpW family protein [Oscillospiraceae bacterium]|nr:transposon-encoded TnpW family protein [Oscillospiraceae bacterium]
MEGTPIQSSTSQTQTFTRRIGSTTYRVTARFNPINQETMEDKILRMMQNEIATEEAGKPEKSIEIHAA